MKRAEQKCGSHCAEEIRKLLNKNGIVNSKFFFHNNYKKSQGGNVEFLKK